MKREKLFAFIIVLILWLKILIYYFRHFAMFSAL